MRAKIEKCPSDVCQHQKGKSANIAPAIVRNFSTQKSDCKDFSELSEIEKKFNPKKKASLLLSESYGRLHFTKKSRLVASCGSFLEFRHALDADGVPEDSAKLSKANFCRDRLCPMCAWRRSYKIFAQVSQIMNFLGNDYKYLFLTLTVPNCSAEQLSITIDEMNRAFTRLMHRKAVKGVVLGYFRALEITYNKIKNTYHPHYHCVLAVPPSYGKHSYISHNKWLELWKQATRDESITQVDIRVVKDKQGNACEDVSRLSSAVAEVAKYAVKSSDYIFADDANLTDRLVSVFSQALRQRMLVQYGGCFKDAFKRLKLLDIESDADLVHISDDAINPSIAYLICHYAWSAGFYKLIDSRIEKNIDIEVTVK